MEYQYIMMCKTVQSDNLIVFLAFSFPFVSLSDDESSALRSGGITNKQKVGAGRITSRIQSENWNLKGENVTSTSHPLCFAVAEPSPTSF